MSYLKANFHPLLIVVIGLFPLFPLFYPGLPVTHDGQDHVARIANFYQSLSEGNIVPRWAGNLNWGYGHPILMFLYPFPSYASSFFHFLGFSLVDSVKIVFGITYILSGVGMYLWIRNVWGEKAGVIAGVVYMYAPYRFIDLYVRGAIGEHVAFLFAPFICYFLFKLSKKSRYSYFLGLSLSTAGLLLSHNAMAIMFMPIIFLYGLTLSNLKYKTFYLKACIAGIIGVGISFFFLYPAFFEGKYTLRDVVTGSNEYRNSFVFFYQFFDLSWSFGGTQFLSKQLGLPIILAFFVAIIVMTLNKFKKPRTFYIFGGSILVSVFLMMHQSDFIWQNITLIQKFQFPWRFLSVVVFSGSVLAGMSVYYMKTKKYQNILIGIFIAAVLLSLPFIKAQLYLVKPENFYSGIYHSTTDTGESAPVWSVRFMEKAAEKPVEVIDGDAVVSGYTRNSTVRLYEIDAKTNVRIRENTLYFPNWEVYVNGKKTEIEYQDELNRGLITFYVPKGNSNIAVIFHDTKLRTFANLVSIFSILILIAIAFLPKKIIKYGT